MIFMLIDSHAHLDFRHYNRDREAVIRRAYEEGIGVIINVGADLSSSRASLSLSDKYEGIYSTIGIHPHEARHVQGDVIQQLKELIVQDTVVAIGETGLDFHYNNSPRDIQERVFRTHIRLAHQFQLPLVIHSRESDKRLLEILTEEKAEEVGGVIHCFNGDRSLAQKYLQLGFYLGLGGVITFPKAREIREAIPSLPLSRILLETDAPYLTPIPHRGKRNEPAYLIHVAQEISNLMGIPFHEVAEKTRENTQNLFGKIKETPQ